MVLLFSKAETSHSLLMQLKPLVLPAALRLCVWGHRVKNRKSEFA